MQQLLVSLFFISNEPFITLVQGHPQNVERPISVGSLLAYPNAI